VGNISKRIDDAHYNMDGGRFEAALCLLVSAVDGSSRKVYPEGTKSLKNPKENMGNKERYTRFTGVRIRQMFLGPDSLPENIYYEGELPNIINQEKQPELIIYEMFRCVDAHESGLQDENKYVFDDGINEQYGMKFVGGEIKFSRGFLKLLENIVVYAVSNGKEFGINHWRLQAKNGDTLIRYIEDFSSRKNLQPSKMHTLMMILLNSGLECLSGGDLNAKNAINQAIPNNGLIASLSHYERYDPIIVDLKITDRGLLLLREISAGLEFVDVAQ